MGIFGENELDKRLREVLEIYNECYNTFSSDGERLYNKRRETVSLIIKVTRLINSIANHPKKFDTKISEIEIERKKFLEAEDFAKNEVEVAKKSVLKIGGGVTNGMVVATLAPKTAMWVATTFGTASTGTAISSLSGAVATKAALAWLGGGALAAGGGGVAGGTALLAFAGPVGFGVASVTILTSVVLFVKNKVKNNELRKEEIKKVNDNIQKIKIVDGEICVLIEKIDLLFSKTSTLYDSLKDLKDKNYNRIKETNQIKLGTLVNETKVLSYFVGEKLNAEKKN